MMTNKAHSAANGQPHVEQGTPSSFAGNRIRLQRLNDAKFFSGWVVSCTSDNVKIKLNGDAELQPGQEFAGEAHGAGGAGRLRVALEMMDGEVASFRMTAPINYGAGVEQARYIVDGITCSFTLDGRSVTAEVTDFSAGGIGVRMYRSVPPGTDVGVSVSDGKLTVFLDAQVRHCRLDPTSPGQYRAGMLVCPSGPEQAYAWETLRTRLMGYISQAA